MVTVALFIDFVISRHPAHDARERGQQLDAYSDTPR
jgi:hypothetical protein